MMAGVGAKRFHPIDWIKKAMTTTYRKPPLCCYTTPLTLNRHRGRVLDATKRQRWRRRPDSEGNATDFLFMPALIVNTQVYGTTNLRVVDLSIVPIHFAAHSVCQSSHKSEGMSVLILFCSQPLCTLSQNRRQTSSRGRFDTLNSCRHYIRRVHRWPRHLHVTMSLLCIWFLCWVGMTYP
jgi:hypothetical protein